MPEKPKPSPDPSVVYSVSGRSFSAVFSGIRDSVGIAHPLRFCPFYTFSFLFTRFVRFYPLFFVLNSFRLYLQVFVRFYTFSSVFTRSHPFLHVFIRVYTTGFHPCKYGRKPVNTNEKRVNTDKNMSKRMKTCE